MTTPSARAVATTSLLVLGLLQLVLASSVETEMLRDISQRLNTLIQRVGAETAQAHPPSKQDQATANHSFPLSSPLPSLQLDSYPKLYFVDPGAKFNVVPREKISSSLQTQYYTEYALRDILKSSPLVVHTPEEADLYFVDVYIHSMDVLGGRQTPAGKTRQQHLAEYCEQLFAALQTRREWQRYNGADHVVIKVYPWSTCFNVASSHKVSWIVLASDEFATPQLASPSSWPLAEQRVMIPYYSEPLFTDTRYWRPAYGVSRPYRICFYGTVGPRFVSRGRFKAAVKDFLALQPEWAPSIFFDEMLGRHWNGTEMVHIYSQCVLCPIFPGDTSQSRRLFTTVLLGCVPVLFADSIRLPFASRLDWSTFVFDLAEEALKNNTRNIVDVLLHLPAAAIESKQQALDNVRHHFVYHDTGIQAGDAVDMTLADLSDRVRIQKQWRRIQRNELNNRREQTSRLLNRSINTYP